jgi:hypothetical protein
LRSSSSITSQDPASGAAMAAILAGWADDRPGSAAAARRAMARCTSPSA